jgi:hypothetical protein
MKGLLSPSVLILLEIFSPEEFFDIFLRVFFEASTRTVTALLKERMLMGHNYQPTEGVLYFSFTQTWQRTQEYHRDSYT